MRNYLLYSLAIIGGTFLFIAAYIVFSELKDRWEIPDAEARAKIKKLRKDFQQSREVVEQIKNTLMGIPSASEIREMVRRGQISEAEGQDYIERRSALEAYVRNEPKMRKMDQSIIDMEIEKNSRKKHGGT